ncbi:MAG: hypothetical protein ACI9G1_004213, partial [Pirellulaceae bacterium]
DQVAADALLRLDQQCDIFYRLANSKRLGRVTLEGPDDGTDPEYEEHNSLNNSEREDKVEHEDCCQRKQDRDNYRRPSRD